MHFLNVWIKTLWISLFGVEKRTFQYIWETVNRLNPAFYVKSDTEGSNIMFLYVSLLIVIVILNQIYNQSISLINMLNEECRWEMKMIIVSGFFVRWHDSASTLSD